MLFNGILIFSFVYSWTKYVILPIKFPFFFFLQVEEFCMALDMIKFYKHSSGIWKNIYIFPFLAAPASCQCFWARDQSCTIAGNQDTAVTVLDTYCVTWEFPNTYIFSTCQYTFILFMSICTYSVLISHSLIVLS